MGKTVGDLWREATYELTGLPMRSRVSAKEAYRSADIKA